MIRHSNNASESWRTLPWKKFRRDLFRLQKRVFKAIQEGDRRRAASLQKLILKSTAARLMQYAKSRSSMLEKRLPELMVRLPSHSRIDSL